VVATGLLLLATGLTLLGLLVQVDRGYLSVLPGLLVLALGVGLVMSPSTTAITASLPEDKQGVASALNDTAREIGAAVSIALFGSLLNGLYRSNVSDATSRLPLESADVVKGGIGGALSVAGRLGPRGAELLHSARIAWVDSMRPTLWLAAAVAVTAAIYTGAAAVHGPDHEIAEPTPEPDSLAEVH